MTKLLVQEGKSAAMMNMKKGFSLAEVLVVVVILGVLASLIIPRFTGQSERAMVAEAVSMLSAIRQAEESYNLGNGSYTNNLTSLDIVIPGGTKFSYVVDGSGNGTATRLSGIYFNNTITLAITGTWGGTHPFKPTN